MSATATSVRHCPWCGPRTVLTPSYQRVNPDTIICPTCDLDPIEVRYTERIIRLGGAEVYRQEWRAAHGLPPAVAS